MPCRRSEGGGVISGALLWLPLQARMVVHVLDRTKTCSLGFEGYGGMYKMGLLTSFGCLW